MSVKDQPTTVATLIADYQAGAGTKKLAARYRVCRETVECLLRKHGVPIRARGGVPGLRERPPEMIQALCADYRAGTGTVKLGKAYQLHPDTVIKILRQNGVEIRPPPLAWSPQGASRGGHVWRLHRGGARGYPVHIGRERTTRLPGSCGVLEL